jgi:hypothetical protein
MPADFTIKQGDTEPSYADQLTYSTGEVVKLEGAKVTMTMRTLTSSRPVALTGTVTIIKASTGEIAYTFSEADTAIPGMYLASWLVVFADGARMTFPTTGYLWFSVEESLAAESTPLLVGLPEILDQLHIPANDRVHDSKLTEWLEALAPLIENFTGPLIPKVYDEWYGGGHSNISLRHKPSYGFGTDPILELMAVSEYRGPIEYNLAIIGNPTQGSIYSCELNAELGIVVRRTAGGGVMPFWRDPEHGDQTVHIVYRAGQETVPPNAKMAAVETIKWWWDATQPMGRGAMTLADAEPARPMVSLPYHVEAMLAPQRRYPAIA